MKNKKTRINKGKRNTKYLSENETVRKIAESQANKRKIKYQWKRKKEDKQRSGKIEIIQVIKKEKIERKKRKRNKIWI